MAFHEVTIVEIKGFPHYSIGSDGTVWSSMLGKTQVLNGRIRATDHRRSVCLRRGGKSYDRIVARLVLEAFVGPCPDGMEACHFPDRNPLNCSVQNLRWDTKKGNAKDREAHGTAPIGEKNAAAKLREVDVAAIREMASQGVAQRVIAARFGVSQACVSLAVSKKTWRTQGGAA